MRFSDFTRTSKQMVLEYNHRCVRYAKKNITLEDVYIEHTINNKDCMVCVMTVASDKINKYIVSYDKKEQRMRFYLTKEIKHKEMEETLV